VENVNDTPGRLTAEIETPVGRLLMISVCWPTLATTPMLWLEKLDPRPFEIMAPAVTGFTGVITVMFTVDVTEL